MGNLENFVPDREVCLEMIEIPLLMKLFGNSMFIWINIPDSPFVWFREGGSLCIPAPTIQEMHQLLRAYGATIELDKGKLFLTDWYMTLIIGSKPAMVYNISDVNEMARACIELITAVSKGEV